MKRLHAVAIAARSDVRLGIPVRRRARFVFVLLLAVLCLPAGAAAQQLTVSAAASLTQVFRDLAALFEQAHPGVTVRLNLGGSGVLLQQIAQGAPVDVLAAADAATIQRGIERGLLDADTRMVFAANSLVLIVPAGEPGGLNRLEDLRASRVERIAIGKPAIVPVGSYAREALEVAGLWADLQAKLIQADNVRQVLEYVARGEVSAGFVYRTDACAMPEKVRVVLTVQGRQPVTYPAAVVKESRRKALAGEFVQFLRLPAAREVLTRHGFLQP
jgi:molybdate transport system substrate-binding protein